MAARRRNMVESPTDAGEIYPELDMNLPQIPPGQGFGPHAKQIMGDVPNYTDIKPVAQMSEVVVG